MEGYKAVNVVKSLDWIGYDRPVLKIYYGLEGQCCSCKEYKKIIKFDPGHDRDQYQPSICKECFDNLWGMGMANE